MGLGGENGGGKNKDRDKTKTNMVFKNLRKKIFKKYSFYIIILKWDLLLIFLLYFLYSFPVKVRITHSLPSLTMQIHFFRGGMGIIRTPILGRLEKCMRFFSKIGVFREGGIILTRYFFWGQKFREGTILMRDLFWLLWYCKKTVRGSNYFFNILIFYM